MKSRPKPDKPDEVFEAPGFRMERRGRFASLQTRRTPEEHRRFIRRVVDSRPKLLQDAQKATQDLLDLAHRFNSLELLAQLWFANSVGDPDEYKEYSFEGRPPYVEHLAVLELKDPGHQVRTLEMPSGADIEKAQELLETIFQRTFFYYGSEALDPDKPGPIPRLAELRFDTIVHELVVRSPTYYSHFADILQELFGEQFVSEWMRSELGFDIKQALKCIQAISDLMMARLRDRREKAIKFAADLRNYVKEFKKTGKFTGPEQAREVTNRIRNMRGKEAKRAIKAAAIAWTFYELHETVAFTATELAEKAGVELTAVESLLKNFCLQFGSTPSDYVLPQPTSPLRLRPVIKFGEKYFCPAVHLLIWALKPQVERLLKPGSTQSINSNANLWERYQKRRSDFLLQGGLTYFRDLLPRSKAYRNLNYTILEDGVEKVVELDGLVLFDRYVFLIEAKAGELSPSARRGGKLRLVSDLKELVEDPHRQALRASAYISAVERPTFQLEDGNTVQLEKKDYKEIFMVTLTLESIDVFTKELYQLRELGIFETDEFPWAISINDLRIIAETLDVPVQFIHFLKWRLYLNQRIKITAQSELDWLGSYLAERPKLPSVRVAVDFMTLGTYTTQFDDFYLYEQGERTKPALRPSQFCPPEIKALLVAIERLDGHDYTAAAEALLSLTFEERKLLARQIRKLSSDVGRGLSKELQFVGDEAVLVLKGTISDAEDFSKSAQSVAREKARTTAVFALADGDPSSLTAWGVCEMPRTKSVE